MSQWLKRGRENGEKALAARKHPGRETQLSKQQKQQIPALLAKGAEAYGFHGDVWNRRRVAAVLLREFGVKHCLQHVGTLMRQCRWTPQKPVRRARQRDEAAIAAWPKTRSKFLKKSVP